MIRRQVDPLAFVAVLFLFFMLYHILQDTQGLKPTLALDAKTADKQAAAAFALDVSDKLQAEPEPASLVGMDIDALAPPYEHYAVTQGPHGFSYGHAAVDLSAGKGAVILSPINGVVTQLYIDDLGNTTLIIENDRYQVTILHGIYTVAVGDLVRLGQAVGQESNQGNTVDALGVSCRGRDCGYHIHLNVYDKRLGANINPLEFWQ